MPPTRRQVFRRRRAVVAATLALVVSAGVYLPATLLAPVAPATASIDSIERPAQAASALAWPSYGASAIGAIGFDGVLASSGTTEAVPIASISKIVTALVVLDSKPLAAGESGPAITFTAADAALYAKYLRVNGKVEPIAPGVVMSQREALEVVLVSSANNYAESLVAWAFGSQEAFIDAAAAWLSVNGLDETSLVEPTGMSPLNVSSAGDLVDLGKLALAHPVIAEIVATPSTEVPYVGRIENSNELLGMDGIDGIKTGTLDEAGACLLFSADYSVGSDTVTVVGVVLGGVDHDSLGVAIQALLESAAAGFEEIPLARRGEAFASYQTAWDGRTNAVAAEDASVLVWSDTPVTADVSAETVTVARSGETVGSVAFTAGGRTVTVPLVLDAGIDEPGPWWRLSHPLELIG